MKHFSTTTYKLEDTETVVKVSGREKKQNMLNFISSKLISFKTFRCRPMGCSTSWSALSWRGKPSSLRAPLAVR